MRNQLGHKANTRFAPRIADMLSRPTEVRRSFVGVLSGGLVGGGAIAFPIGLAFGTSVAPGLLLAAATCLGGGALALLLNRAGRSSGAILVHALTLSFIGLVAAWVHAAFVPGAILIALAGSHFIVWQEIKSTWRRWLALMLMAILATALTAMSAHLLMSGAAIALAVFDVAAVSFLYSNRQADASADEHALAELLESISDGLIRLTCDGKLMHASPSTEKMFGCKPYSLTQMGLVERVHVLDRPAFLKTVSDTSHDGVARQVEVRMRRDPAAHENAETRFIWSELALCRVSEDTGDAVVVGLIRDISGRKAQEQRLEEARLEAEQASSSKSLFLATMGHELRTPLNAIVGFAEMMTSGIGGTLDDTHAEYVSLIGQSGRHLLDVVNMLLDMSKINAGKFELHIEEFEPDSLVEPSLHIVSAMARTNRVHLKTDVAAALPIIKGDERACRQIIINLLSNAIKFSHVDGKVSLSIRRQGAKLSIAVSDQGIGMTREQVNRIGEPFFQAHAGLARQYEGTGLGLSIVKGLVELHDGVMRAKSSPDEGTTITVLLPLLGPESEHEAPPLATLPLAVGAAEKSHFEPSGKRSIAS